MAAKSIWVRGAAVVAVAAGLVTSTAVAHADPLPNSATVTTAATAVSPASTQRSVGVGVLGHYYVAVPKVSNPSVVVTATGSAATPTVTVTRHAAGENKCSSADDPDAGTFNRTVWVTPSASGSTTVFVGITYTTTTPDGVSTTTPLNPLGDSGTLLPTGLLGSSDPVQVTDICVAA
jgi:hypothetical protein